MKLDTAAAFGWLVSRYARPYAGVITGMIALTFATNVLTVLQPALLAALLANLTGQGGAPVPAGTSWLDLNHLGAQVSQRLTVLVPVDALVLFAGLFVAVSILVAVLNYAGLSAATWLRAHVGRSIQLDLLERLFAQDMLFFSRQKGGELVSRVTFDTTVTAIALGPLILSLVHNLVQIAAYSAYLFSTSVWLTVGSIALILVHFSVTQGLKQPMRRLAREETDVSAALLAALQETFTSIRVAKSFGAEAFELAKLRGATAAAVRTSWRKGRIEKLEVPARSVVDALALLGVFLIAIGQMRAGALSFQGLLLFTFVARSLITPINHLATSALWIESLTAASGRIRELLARRPTVVDGSTVKTTFERSLLIDRCSFAYDGRPAIEAVTLEIARGEFIAVVGPSGAGKSTLADLILRLHDPDAGAILIDGSDLRTLRQREYRRMFGVVSQENLLFHDSVLNNIRYGRNEVTDAMVEQAARVANAHQFIVALPQGYQTVVGDRGVRLSGGERQRIAIARAVVHNPQILILDEATSALDSESEHLVQEALDQIVEQTTTIVIAHRLSTVMHADRIVVLNQGAIEAVGRHQQLLDTSPTYQRLCRLQFDRPTEAATLT